MNLSKRVSGVVAAALIVIGVVLASSSPASADAKGCTPWGARTIGGLVIPAGTYCTTVVVTGTPVRCVQSEFYAPRVCNWDVTAEFFSNNWTWKKTYVSKHNFGCSYGTAWAPYIAVNSSIGALTGTSTGYMCSTLRVAYQRVTSHCHYIR